MERAQYEEAREIWHKITKYQVDEHPSQEIELYKKMLNLFHVGNFYYYIYNCVGAEIEWTNNAVSKVLGLACPANFSVEFILANIHPADAPYVLEFERRVTAFFSQLPLEKILKYKVSYDYRMQKDDGSYVRILQQVITIQTTKNGGALRLLGVHTDINHLKNGNISTLSFMGLDGEPSYCDVCSSSTILNVDQNLLSKREKEILAQLMTGKNSFEIGKKLFISKHTVDTHRKNMLKKTGAISTVDLIIKSIRENLCLLATFMFGVSVSLS